MKILVTGDRGYIGPVLIKQLLARRYTVVGMDTDFFVFSPPLENNSYRKIHKDIRQVNERDLYGIEAIIHLAALSNDPLGALNMKLTEDINYKATIRLAKLAKKSGVKRFIFSSSCSIYGKCDIDEVNEQSTVAPLTAYAKSKIDTEKGLLALASDDFCVVLMRNSTVYGYSPNLRIDLVVNNLVAHAVTTGEIKILSDGTPWRPLIDVRDLSRICINFLEIEKEKVNGVIVNIGFAENNVQVKDIALRIQKRLSACTIVYSNEHGKDTRSYKVNFDKFHMLFSGLRQEWTIEKSIDDLVSYFKRNNFSHIDITSGKYERIAVLKQLLMERKVDSRLYWIT